MNKTIETVVEEILCSQRLTAKIKENIQLKKEEEMVLNLFQLRFDFSNNEVVITYFMKDEQFPETKMNLLEFGNLLKDSKKRKAIELSL